MVVVIYWLMLSKHRSFRKVTTALLLGGWPAAALLGLIHPFSGLGGALALGLLSWALSCAVWVTYLHRSQRVRVTFEHCVSPEHEADSEVGSQGVVPMRFPAVARAELAGLHHTEVKQQPAAPPTPQRGGSVQRGVKAQVQETPTPVQTAASSDEDLWAIAAEEVDGPTRRRGLWAKAFADAQGDEAGAKVNYLKWRVEQLQREATVRQQQALAEQAARQRANEQQASAEAAQIDRYRRSVKELDTSPERVLLAFVESVPDEHAAFVFSLRNDIGGTLLHTAAREGFPALAEALLAKGADPSLAGAKGLLPHQLAARNGHARLAQRLEQSYNAHAGQARSET